MSSGSFFLQKQGQTTPQTFLMTLPFGTTSSSSSSASASASVSSPFTDLTDFGFALFLMTFVMFPLNEKKFINVISNLNEQGSLANLLHLPPPLRILLIK